MKKLLYSLLALATMAFAASCARENLGAPATGETVEATFRVALPETAGTKAISDGTKATELLFFAFDGNGKYLANVKPAEAVTVSGYEAAVTVKLIKGMTYNFVFWAQKPGQYTNLITAADGTAGATLDISSVIAGMMNNDDFDAFYGRIKDYKVERAFSTETLYLTRPFAQLNVGAYADDIAAAQASNLDTDNISTKYFAAATTPTMNVYTTFDLLTGQASGGDEIDFTAALRPQESLQVDNETYTWIAMLYLLQNAPDYYDSNLAFSDQDESKDMRTEVSFNIATKQNGDAVDTDRSVFNVPIQRNYRTNILGNIFSVDGTFNIKVDQNFQKVGDVEQTYLPEYENIAALNAAFAKADATDAAKWSYKVKLLAAGDVKTITLPNTTDPVDIVFADGEWAAEEITIEYAADPAAKPTKLTLSVDHLAKLTAALPATHIDYTAGTIDEAVITSSNSTFVIEKDATVTNLIILGGGLLVEGTLGDADVTTGGAATVTIAAEGEVTGTLKVNDGALVIENGADLSAADVNVSINATVTDNSETPVEVEYFGEIETQTALEKALAAGGEFKLAADIVTDAQFVVPAGKTVVLDMDGKTISNTADIWDTSIDAWSLISVQGGELTIKGDGKFLAKENDEYAADVRDGGKLVIENGTFAGNITGIYAYEGTVEVKGGTFYVQQLASTATDRYRFTLNCLDGNFKNGKSTIVVTGGTFKEFDPASNLAEGTGTNFLAAGYISTASVDDNGATWYTVEEGAREVPSFSIDNTTLALYVGGTGEIVLTNTSDGALTVESSDPTVATVALEDGKYVVTAVGAGSADINFAVAQSKNFEAATAKCEVTVTAVQFESIYFSKNPEKVEFAYSEEFSFDGEVKAVYNNGNEIPVSNDDLTISGYSATTPGVQEITVSYNSYPITYSVTVAEQVITYTTIAELKELMEADANWAISSNVTLGEVVVNYTSTSNAYIEDETGGMVIYKKSHGLVAGKKYKGIVVSATTKYNTYFYEITGFDAADATEEDVTLTETVVTADKFTTTELKKYQYMRLKVEGIKLSAAVSSDNRTVTATQGTNSMQVYFPSMTIKTESVVNAIGSMTVYSGNVQMTVSSSDNVTVTTEGIETTTITGLANKSIKQGESLDFSTIVSSNFGTVAFALSEAATGITIDGSTVSVAADAEVGATATITATVTRSEGNYTAATATATITVSDATTQPSTTKTYTMSITIDNVDLLDDSQSSTYAKYNGEHSVVAKAEDDTELTVSFKTYQVMPSSGNMQMQKNNVCIWNTTDLGTISSVTIDDNTNCSYIIGSDEKPTETATGGYFAINSGSKASYASKITVIFVK